MHKATKIGLCKYQYRGFIIQDMYRSGWQIMWRDVHGWLAAANTLRQAKTRIDHWYEARQTGERVAPQFIEAVERVLADACERGEPADCPAQHLCRHGIDN
jgi:hypothetical protein